MTVNYESKRKEVKAALAAARRRTLEAIGTFVLGETVVRCPVGQYPAGSGRVGGNLRSSYDYKVNEPEGAVYIGTNVDYAPWVEKGTRKMSARPHLTPAAEENIARIRRLAEENHRL